MMEKGEIGQTFTWAYTCIGKTLEISMGEP